MANPALLLLADPNPLCNAIAQEAAIQNLSVQLEHHSQWPWHDSDQTSQRLRQSGASIVIITTLSEPEPKMQLDIETLISCCAQHHIVVFLCSSCEVFSGQQGGLHSEKDLCDGQSPLGFLAIATEEILRHHCPRHLILRPCWLFSGIKQDLVGHFLQQARDLETLKVNDQLKITPLSAGDWAKVVIAMIKQAVLTEKLWGTYHYASSETIGLYHFAEAVISEARQYGPLRLQQLEICEQAPMPALNHMQGGLLSGKKLMYSFGIKPKAWRPTLAKDIRNVLGKTEEKNIA